MIMPSAAVVGVGCAPVCLVGCWGRGLRLFLRVTPFLGEFPGKYQPGCRCCLYSGFSGGISPVFVLLAGNPRSHAAQLLQLGRGHAADDLLQRFAGFGSVVEVIKLLGRCRLLLVGFVM